MRPYPTLLLLLLPFFVRAQDCDLPRYRQLMREADQLAYGKKPDYQLSVNKLLSAKTCQPDSESVVNRVLVKVFEEVNRQREMAVQNEREAKRQQQLAKTNAEKALVQQRIAEKKTRAAKNVALYGRARETDQTLAFRVAQYNLWQHPEDVSSALNFQRSINDTTVAFYRSILNDGDATPYTVEFSPDGQKAFTGTSEGVAKYWDLKTQQLIQVFAGHQSDVYAVAVAPDGKSILTGSGDSTARVWDVASAQTLQTFRGHLGAVFSVDFSLDGLYALTGSTDRTLKLWDMASGACIQTYTGHSDEVSSVALSPDGKWAVSGSEGVRKETEKPPGSGIGKAAQRSKYWKATRRMSRQSRSLPTTGLSQRAALIIG
jgi:hypothetical protein